MTFRVTASAQSAWHRTVKNLNRALKPKAGLPGLKAGWHTERYRTDLEYAERMDRLGIPAVPREGEMTQV